LALVAAHATTLEYVYLTAGKREGAQTIDVSPAGG